jgi:hypothetical protein
VCAPSAGHRIFSLTITIDLHAGIVDTLFLKGKEKKEQLHSHEVEDHLENVLSQPEYKQQQIFFLFHRFFYSTY